MTQPGVEIWLFGPKDRRVRDHVKFIREECHKRGWELNQRNTTMVRSPEGRPFMVVRDQDASNLYQRVHRAFVGVWQIGKAHVSIRPEGISPAKNYVTLRRFVVHKAFHNTISEKNSQFAWRMFCDGFQAWMRQVGCDGEADPRCLPLHVFKTELDLDALATEEGRSLFGQTHGPQSSRVDSNELHWRRPRGPYHGRDSLYVAGRNLAKGFHWDVSTQGTTRRIATTSEIWEIRRNGYVNVYPDQYVRGGKLSKRKRKAR